MELILKAIKSLFRKTEKDIEEAKALANGAVKNVENASKIYFVNVEYKSVGGTYSTTETRENIKEKYEAGFMIFAKLKRISTGTDHIYPLIMYSTGYILSFSRPAYNNLAATTERLDFSWDNNNSVYKITHATKE